MPHSKLSLAARVAVAAALLAAFAAVPAAHAGFGGLTGALKDKAAKVAARKAADAVSPAAAADGGTAGSGKVEFNDVVLELTDARLEQFLKGLAAGKPLLKDHHALTARKDQMLQEEGQITDKDGPAMDAAREARQRIESCRDEAFGKIRSAREKDMQQRVMSDPDLRAKMMSLAMRVGTAQASGDTTELRKVQQEMEALANPFTRADTLGIDRTCGPLPAMHPSAVRLQKLQDQAAAIDGQLRDMEEKASAAEIEASGMTAPQFGMVRERIEMFLAAPASGPARGFTADERKALAAHRAAIEAALAS